MLSSISDPKKIGPGVWGTWHALTLKQTSLEDKKILMTTIQWTIETFKCLVCRAHAIEYLADNPFPQLSKNGEELFIWTIDFHNVVNERLGKEYIDIEDAKKIWSGENVCLQDCDGEHPIDIEVMVTDEERKSFRYKTY